MGCYLCSGVHIPKNKNPHIHIKYECCIDVLLAAFFPSRGYALLEEGAKNVQESQIKVSKAQVESRRSKSQQGT